MLPLIRSVFSCLLLVTVDVLQGSQECGCLCPSSPTNDPGPSHCPNYKAPLSKSRPSTLKDICLPPLTSADTLTWITVAGYVSFHLVSHVKHNTYKMVLNFFLVFFLLGTTRNVRWVRTEVYKKYLTLPRSNDKLWLFAVSFKIYSNQCNIFKRMLCALTLVWGNPEKGESPFSPMEQWLVALKGSMSNKCPFRCRTNVNTYQPSTEITPT